MDTGELKVRLGRILAEEEGDGPTDWEEVERLSSELLGFRVQLLLYRRNKSEPGL